MKYKKNRTSRYYTFIFTRNQNLILENIVLTKIVHYLEKKPIAKYGQTHFA